VRVKRVKWGRCADVRVGNVETSQIVGSVAEEVEQSIAGRRHYLWYRLTPSALRYHETTDKEFSIE